jgi:predicted negative regulator of RcsB-dependent stress response
MRRSLGAILLAGLIVASPVLLGATRTDDHDGGQPNKLELVKYIRSALAEKGDEGLVSLARLGKVHLYVESGRPDEAIKELTVLAGEAKDREILLLTHAMLTDLNKKARRYDDGIAALDKLIARVKTPSK